MSALPDQVPLPLGHREGARAARRPAVSGSAGRGVAADLPFAAVAVATDLASSAEAWRALEAVAPASPYQTQAWIAAWLATEGAATGVRPLIAVARDGKGRPVALLPLGVSRRGGTSVAAFLGGRQSNYNLGLFDPAVAWSAAAVEALVRAAAAASPVRLDMISLANQPHDWLGWANPLALLPRQPSPSFAHRAVLVPDGEDFLRAHLSTSARKKMRNKTAQLEALGPVRHLRAATPEEIDRVLDAYAAQKAAKLSTIGAIARTDLDLTRRLLAQAARHGGPDSPPPPLDLHALLCGERVVATFCGLAHDGRLSGLAISHDADPAFGRLSPGELLLARVVVGACAAGFTSFDLGIGEARYKESYCPIRDALFDSLLPLTSRGRLCVLRDALRLRVKRRIKRSSWLWPLLLRLRKQLKGVRPPAP